MALSVNTFSLPSLSFSLTTVIYRVSKETIETFDGLSNKKYVADLQNEMFIYQSKANLDWGIS